MNKEQIKTWLTEMVAEREEQISIYESRIEEQPESNSNARRLRSIGYKKEDVEKLNKLIGECDEQKDWMENMHIKGVLQAWFTDAMG